MGKKALIYFIFGLCAFIISIFIAIEVLMAMISAVWFLAAIGLVCSGFYLILSGAKKYDEKK